MDAFSVKGVVPVFNEEKSAFTVTYTDPDTGVESEVTISELKVSDHVKDGLYFSIIDPKSGYKYDIPMLSTLDPSYYFKYVYFMKLKESSPSAFEKILRWD